MTESLSTGAKVFIGILGVVAGVGVARAGLSLTPSKIPDSVCFLGTNASDPFPLAQIEGKSSVSAGYMVGDFVGALWRALTVK